MGDVTLIFDKRNMIATLEDETIRIDCPGKRCERVPLKMIDQVIVIGSPLISCDILRFLSYRNISIVFLPIRGKGDACYTSPGLSLSVDLRCSQYQAIFNKKTSLNIARWLVTEKIQGQMAVIEKLSGDDYSNSLYLDCINGVGFARDVDQIMGYEGVAASDYFHLLRKIIPEKWGFKGRNRRPPKDPFNSMLSLSYTLALGEIKRKAQIIGFDTAGGYLHAIQRGRESFLLDILEPVRPIVDTFVIETLNNSFTPNDFFTSPKDGCRLKKAGRQVFYERWSEFKRPKCPLKNKIKSVLNCLIENHYKGVI